MVLWRCNSSLQTFSRKDVRLLMHRTKRSHGRWSNLCLLFGIGNWYNLWFRKKNLNSYRCVKYTKGTQKSNILFNSAKKPEFLTLAFSKSSIIKLTTTFQRVITSFFSITASEVIIYGEYTTPARRACFIKYMYFLSVACIKYTAWSIRSWSDTVL